MVIFSRFDHVRFNPFFSLVQPFPTSLTNWTIQEKNKQTGLEDFFFFEKFFALPLEIPDKTRLHP